MRTSNLSFPYPVLGVKDDVQGQHKVEVGLRLSGSEVKISGRHVLFNETIEELVKQKRAAFCAQVMCPKTFFRTVYCSPQKEQEIVIPQDHLRDSVSVDFFIAAQKDIPEYGNKKAHKDYAGYNFFVGKADVLSFGGTFNFIASKQWMATKSISSFMSIRQGDFQSGPVKIDLTSSNGKIVIELSKNDFERYRKNSRNESFYPIYHSCIVFPALLYAVTQMLLPDGADSYSDYLWFQVLDERKRSDKTLSELDWDPANAAEIAQAILDNPINRAFGSMDDLVINEGEE